MEDLLTTRIEAPPIAGRIRHRPSTDTELDMTPMVDVTFLLLIFFMVTASFLLQKAIQAPPSSAEDAAAATNVETLEQDSIVVRIDANNIYWVGAPQWTEEQRAPSKQDMRVKVRSARAQGGQLNKLLVQAHGDSLHEFVVAALDAGSAVGMEEIRLMSYDEEVW